MENTETAIGCASRELQEETGIVLETTNVTSMGYRKFTKEGGGYFVYRFEEEATLVPRNNAEIIECGWFSEEDMRDMPCNKDINSFLSLLRSQP